MYTQSPILITISSWTICFDANGQPKYVEVDKSYLFH